MCSFSFSLGAEFVLMGVDRPESVIGGRPFETHSRHIESRMFGTAIEMSEGALVDDE
jgi:hypothetical protein